MKNWIYILGIVIFGSCKQDVEVLSVDYAGLEPLLQKQNDTTYVVNFWATWCKPCVKELPYFEAVNKRASQDKVKVVLVSLDFPENLDSQVKPFIRDKQIKSEVILLADDNANSWIPKVDSTWSGAIPATVIYKKDRRVFIEGSMTQEGIETKINSIQ